MAITINITREMKEKCYYFAAAIVLSKNQFKRLPNEDIIDRIERTFAGKLGEYVFLNYLESEKLIEKNEKEQILDEMFCIFGGESNVDSYDFKTKKNNTIDVKTAYKPFHSLLVVNKDQFEDRKKQKDYYVGVKLNVTWDNLRTLTDYLYDESENKYPTKILKTMEHDIYNKKVDKLKYEKKQILNIDSISEAEICGYISHERFEEMRYNGNEYGNLTKADCKYTKLENLNDIENIKEEFKEDIHYL